MSVDPHVHETTSHGQGHGQLTRTLLTLLLLLLTLLLLLLRILLLSIVTVNRIHCPDQRSPLVRIGAREELRCSSDGIGRFLLLLALEATQQPPRPLLGSCGVVDHHRILPTAPQPICVASFSQRTVGSKRHVQFLFVNPKHPFGFFKSGP
jgi:hypothetical protein